VGRYQLQTDLVPSYGWSVSTQIRE